MLCVRVNVYILGKFITSQKLIETHHILGSHIQLQICTLILSFRPVDIKVLITTTNQKWKTCELFVINYHIIVSNFYRYRHFSHSTSSFAHRVGRAPAPILVCTRLYINRCAEMARLRTVASSNSKKKSKSGSGAGIMYGYIAISFIGMACRTTKRCELSLQNRRRIQMDGGKNNKSKSKVIKNRFRQRTKCRA